MNLIIVESKNDAAFFKSLIDHLNFTTAEVDPPIFLDDDSFLDDLKQFLLLFRC